jgi:DNA-binding beta-propeller fold protein YncE
VLAVATVTPSAAPTSTPLPGRVVGEADAGGSAHALAFDTQRQWLYVRTARGVTLIDAPTRRTLATIDVAGGLSTINGIAVDPALGWVYTTTADGVVHVLAGDLATEIGAVKVGLEPGPIAVDRHTHAIYALDVGYNPIRFRASPRNGVLFVIEPNRMSLVTSVVVPGMPWALAVNAATGKVYVSGAGGPGNSGFLQVIDGDTRAQVALVGATAGVSMASLDADNVLYMTHPDLPDFGPRGKISFIDGRRDQVSTFVSFENASYVAADPVKRHLYLLDRTGHVTIATSRLEFGNPGTWAGSTVSVPANATAIVADPLRHQVFVANSDGKITVVVDDWPPNP